MPCLKSTLFAYALAVASMPVSAMATAPALTGAAVVPKTAPNMPQVPPFARGYKETPPTIPTKTPTLDPPGSPGSRDRTVMPPSAEPVVYKPR